MLEDFTLKNIPPTDVILTVSIPMNDFEYYDELAEFNITNKSNLVNVLLREGLQACLKKKVVKEPPTVESRLVPKKKKRTVKIKAKDLINKL